MTRSSRALDRDQITRLLGDLTPPFAMAGIAVQREGAGPEFHIACAPGLVAGPDTLWRGASLSKVVTGRVALEALAGRVGLAGASGGGIYARVMGGAAVADLAAESFLGWPLRHPGAQDRAVTVGQLASHTAGLDDTGGYLLPPGAALRDWMARADVWAAEVPGQVARYSNLGTVLLAACAECATGRRFDHLARDLVLAPLGLNAGFNWSGVADRTDRLPVFRRDGDGFVAQVDAAVAATGVCGADGQPIDLTGWAPGRNPGVFSPQGGLRLSLRGALTLLQSLADRAEHWLWSGPSADPAPVQAYGWGLMRLDQPDLYPRPLIGHAADAYGLVAGLWWDATARAAFAYVLNGLPMGDTGDGFRPAERAIFGALA